MEIQWVFEQFQGEESYLGKGEALPRKGEAKGGAMALQRGEA